MLIQKALFRGCYSPSYTFVHIVILLLINVDMIQFSFTAIKAKMFPLHQLKLLTA